MSTYIEIDDVIAPAPPPIPVSPPTRVGEVNAANALTAEQDAQRLAKAGFADQDRFFFALGTRIAQGGVDATNAIRREVEERPFADEAAGKFLDVVKLEKRENLAAMPTKEAHVTRDGHLLLLPEPDGRLVRPTELAWSHLGERLDWPGLASFLPQAPPETRKELVECTQRRQQSRYLEALEQYEEERRAYTPKRGQRAPRRPNEPQFTAGIRQGMGGQKFAVPQLFRVGGPRYADLGPEKVVEPFIAALPKEMRATVTYDGNAFSIEAVAASPIAVDGFVGEAFRAGVRLFGDDVKRGRLRGVAFVDRTRCLNGTVVPAEKLGFSLIHTGNTESILTKVTELLAALPEAVSEFVERWGAAKREKIIDEQAGFGPRAILNALLEARLIAVPGKREDALDRFEAAWRMEPGYDVTSIINAITRSAQTDWWQDVNQLNDLEESAGQVLYVKNLVPRVHAVARAAMIELD